MVEETSLTGDRQGDSQAASSNGPSDHYYRVPPFFRIDSILGPIDAAQPVPAASEGL